MSFKIKIDLKKQKIFNSSNMSHKVIEGNSDDSSESLGTSTDKNLQEITFTNADDSPVMEAISDEDDSPAMKSVSDGDDAAAAMDEVSDTDDMPAMEAISDADDMPAMEAVSEDSPVMEAMSDADDTPPMEAASDAGDTPPMEAASDSGDSPPMEGVSESGDTHAMEAVSDTDNSPVVQKIAVEVDSAGGGSSKKDTNPDHTGDPATSVKGDSVECDVTDNSLELDTSHSKSVHGPASVKAKDVRNTEASSSTTVNSKSSDLMNNDSGEADVNGVSKHGVKVKTSDNKSEDDSVSMKKSLKTKNKTDLENISKVKIAVNTPGVQAEFSDNEENMELSPQSKLLEVIFKEDEDEDSEGAFIPEVECTVEETEDNSEVPVAAPEKAADADADSVSTKDVLTAESVATEEDTNDASYENEDSYLDATGNYDGESCDVDETMQTYAKEFLYSDTSSLGPELDASGSEDGGKRITLNRFPKIVKAVGAAEYALLQDIYRLLYIRNPWDTKEVLSARILDFPGFHFAEDSADYFNREVILRGLSQKTLETIAHVLCLSKPISARSNKQRVNLTSRIMKFLMNLESARRSRPASNSNSKAKLPVITPKPVSTPGTDKLSENVSTAKSSKPRSRKSVPSRISTPKSNKKEADLKVNLENVKKEGTFIPVPEVKVELKKIGLNEIREATRPKTNGKKSPTDKAAGAENSEKTSKQDDADEATDTESSEHASDEEIKKLKEFPEVLSNIEGTPEKILSDIHYLLYLEDASLKDLKSNVMEFRGFPVEDGPSEVEERKQFLEKMSDDVIKNIVNTFYLKCSNNKEENIDIIINFLKAPSKRLMKERAEAPDKMLSEGNADLMDGLSDSDDSITCEIVPKKVDCIDLISSGEEEDEKEIKTEEKHPIKKEEVPARPSKRCLHDFETITKIVNTHPHEYLIDIYNLLYQRPCEPSTIRKDILEFTGFEFEKGAEEYVKRKQYLDRMQYNNVRRIFNTLIHNTRDVRVFSKPTMIGEIFQFLFKLPDTDTSIRQPALKGNIVVPAAPKDKVVGNPPSSDPPSNLLSAINKADTSQAPNNSRLSELKRVFQRVACFPCEYLVDVHKLLFMKDCDMKDIRQNIFAFKGFPFGVDSQEFKQRKMYLEYLTFHSLRKISSVLTTKNVDLRNSTKHELSTHLTKVLTEYTNTYMEAEAQEACSQAEEITAQANKAAAAAAQDPNIEKIVVTPVIEGFQAASTNDSSLPRVVDIRSQSKEVSSKSGSVVTSTTATTPAMSQPCKKIKAGTEEGSPVTQTFEKIIIPTVDQPAKQRRRKKANPTQRISEAEALTKAEQMSAAMQFQDIHLPEVESLVRSYQQNPSMLPNIRPKPPLPQPTQMQAIDHMQANYTAIIGPVHQAMPPPNVTIGLPARPSVPFQIIRPFSMQPSVQGLYINQSILTSTTPPLEPIYKDDEPGDFVGALPVECILTEGGEPAAKKPKLAQLLTAPQGSVTARTFQPTQPVQPIKKYEKSHAESSDSPLKPSTSFQLKIRDAMTKESEDEEDCDKPLATLVGHPNDKVLKQQICEIVENTDLQDISINGVIQKIFNMYPKFNLNYRKEFIKSTLRSLLYRLGEQDTTKSTESESVSTNPDSSDQGDSTKSQISSTKVSAPWSVNKS